MNGMFVVVWERKMVVGKTFFWAQAIRDVKRGLVCRDRGLSGLQVCGCRRRRNGFELLLIGRFKGSSHARQCP